MFHLVRNWLSPWVCAQTRHDVRRFCAAVVTKPSNSKDMGVKVPVQRWAAPSTVPQVPANGRSVGAVHAAQCTALAHAPKEGRAADASWEWAAMRTCKLAEDMAPEHLAACAVAFARAARRDVRALFVVAESAILKQKKFGPVEVENMVYAYASLHLRNEMLFRALGRRAVALFSRGSAVAQDVVEEASGLETHGGMSSEALAKVVRAHAELSLGTLPMFPVMCRGLVPNVAKIAPPTAATLFCALAAGTGDAIPEDLTVELLATLVSAEHPRAVEAVVEVARRLPNLSRVNDVLWSSLPPAEFIRQFFLFLGRFVEAAAADLTTHELSATLEACAAITRAAEQGRTALDIGVEAEALRCALVSVVESRLDTTSNL